MSTPPDSLSAPAEAVLLAGSYQWLGSAFEQLRPRPLLPVGPQLLIEHVVDWLSAGGVQQTVVCGNGSTAAIRSFLGTTRGGLPATLLYHEDRSPRGAAGCVKDAARQLTANTLVVADATSIPTFNLADLLDHHRRSGAALTIVAQDLGDSLHPVGAYVVERTALESIPTTSFQDIKENLVPKLYKLGMRLSVYRVGAVSPRVRNATTYLALSQWLVSRSATRATGPNTGGVLVDSTAWISPDALVVGPVYLGAGARVQAGATLVGPTAIGDGSVIESGAVVARSVIWRRCVVGERAQIDQCVMTDDAVAMAGEGMANRVRLPQQSSRFWSVAPRRRVKVQPSLGFGGGSPSPRIVDRMVWWKP